MQQTDGCCPWQSPPHVTAIDAKEVHVWRVNMEQSALVGVRAAKALSFDEQSRAALYKFEHLRRRYAVAHTALRLILSGYLGRDPAAISFSAGPMGKPAIARAPGEPSVEFNLTHSGELCLVAIASTRAVGIDIERCDQSIPVDTIARTVFTAHEQAMLRALPKHDKTRAFLSFWTRKEAVLKAIGCGLHVRPDQLEVSIAPAETNVLRAIWDSREAERWKVGPLPLGDDYVGAIAVEGHGAELRLFNWVGGNAGYDTSDER